MPPRLEGGIKGNRMKEARIRAGYGVAELANLIGVSQPVISYFESGRRVPTINNLQKIAEALGVSVAYLGDFESLPESTFAEKVKKARLYHGLLKKDFALLIGVDTKTIQNWETGRTIPFAKQMNLLHPYLMILK